MGTSKQQRKYKNKTVEVEDSYEENPGSKYRVLINDTFFLDGSYPTHGEAELAAIRYCKTRPRAVFIVVRSN